MSAAATVFDSHELLKAIWAYQVGTYEDFLPLQRLPSLTFQRRDRDMALPVANLATIHSLLTPWYAQNGLVRLPLLLRAMPQTKCALLAHAASVGDLPVLQVVFSSTSRGVALASLMANLVDIAAAAGHLHVLEFLERQGHCGYTSHTLRFAAFAGQLSLLERFASLAESSDAIHQLFGPQLMDWAAAGGQLDVVQWLHATRTEGCTSNAINLAATHGHVHVLAWLTAHRTEGCTSRAVAGAAANGHLACVEYLYDRGTWTDKCPTYGIDMAAANGHLEVVHYLLARDLATETPLSMDLAAKNGHLEVLQYLHTHVGSHGCTVDALDAAAGNGHLEVVQYLTEHCHAVATSRAMDRAAANGHLGVVQYLHDHRLEGCTTNAMTMAALHGHLDVVQWLREHRREGCVAWALHFAKDAAVVAYLQEMPPEFVQEFYGLGLDRILDDEERRRNAELGM
ncbi:Aste57867_2788 [Aphanomyces stellatus]|uniref:Aste57867_2788 protein n=1 Tax=Aphanomyces stellatus TaxID=120398 RepID=A0A485KC23_9STRA|nr:hypothetical protein As57867_002781 [Aphanomyces stellatus]VFT79978.1 Aste57867_2788 [Aphanomyces stellatus]